MRSSHQRFPNPLWVYAYTIVPAQPSRQFDTIRALLEGENLAALSGLGAWAGRLILEEKVVHIFIVSDTPARNREINVMLEAELERMNAAFSVTEPLAVANARPPIPEHKTARGNGH